MVFVGRVRRINSFAVAFVKHQQVWADQVREFSSLLA